VGVKPGKRSGPEPAPRRWTTDSHTRYDEYVKRLTALPVHSRDRIEAAAKQLRMLHFDFELGGLDVDLFEITADELLAVFESIARLSFEELRRTPHFEKPYQSGDREQWAEYARLNRIEFLLKKYEFLVRLRNDEPEAWDAVNELFFDD